MGNCYRSVTNEMGKKLGKRRAVTVTQAARCLRVSRGHLSFVLSGKRQNPRLLADYQLLVQIHATHNPSSENEKRN